MGPGLRLPTLFLLGPWLTKKWVETHFKVRTCSVQLLYHRADRRINEVYSSGTCWTLTSLPRSRVRAAIRRRILLALADRGPGGVGLCYSRPPGPSVFS